MRILLVEDDTLIGDGIKAGLSKMGFSVDWFTEGRRAKRRFTARLMMRLFLDLTLRAWTDGIFCANGAKRVNRNRY